MSLWFEVPDVACLGTMSTKNSIRLLQYTQTKFEVSCKCQGHSRVFPNENTIRDVIHQLDEFYWAYSAHLPDEDFLALFKQLQRLFLGIRDEVRESEPRLTKTARYLVLQTIPLIVQLTLIVDPRRYYW